jgi:hypothetical protein
LHFYAGSATVKTELTVRNPRRARHPGGLWDLGDPASVLLEDLAVRFALPSGDGPAEVRWTRDRSAPVERCTGEFELYQDSSGGENWQSANHQNRDGRVRNAFRGYRIRAAGGDTHGLRATPVVTLARGDREVTVAVPHFWENFPKAIQCAGGELVLRLFPKQYADVHELQGGEQKTHTFFVAFAPDRVTEQPLAWCLSPLVGRAGEFAYRAAGVIGRLAAGGDLTRNGYEALVNAAVEGPDSFAAKRERIDEYGWRHFGDIYADHEAVREPGLISHYNNQYDAIAGFAIRFCQTGDPRWWTEMDALARHVIDIDIYHTTADKSAYNHGLFWHTVHYTAAGTATHRSYSRLSGLSGGGPSAEHNYTTGLKLHHFLSGSEASRAAALELADWVVDMDDGAKSRFRWVDRGETGLASATGSPDDHGPGRGAGNSINALLDAHHLSGDERYLAKAERLMRRCIHPSDDLDRMGLLDVERHWSYTVFLQALGKYLDYVAHRSLDRGDRFDYSRSALLHYADWMRAHERPYLEHPEQLEFPTETWAAQDVRKAAVLDFAARYAADSASQDAFERKAHYFADYAIGALQASPTRTLTRPIAVLLTCGFMTPTGERPRLDGRRTAPEFAPKRAPFVWYKRRVVRRVVRVATVAALASAAAAAWLLLT